MLDDNGKHPIILNDFRKLKIRNELEKSIDDQHKKVLNNIVEDKKYKAKKEAQKMQMQQRRDKIVEQVELMRKREFQRLRIEKIKSDKSGGLVLPDKALLE